MTSRSRTLRVLAAGRRFRKEDKAATIVEFAILLPIVVLLFLGVIDFSLAFNNRLNIVSVTRDLARFFAVQVNPCSPATQSALLARADSIFVRLRTDDPLLSTYITFEPSASGGAGCAIPNNTVSVRTTAYPMRTPFLRVGPLTLNARARFRWERGS